MEKIAIKNLSFKYPQRENYALRDINLTVNQGDFITLCGKSGCGKSTLLRLLKPAIAPYGEKTGEILTDGTEVNSLDERTQAQKIGFVMQSYENQLVCNKVWHEMAFGLENLGCKPEEIRLKVAEMAAFFNLSHLYHREVSTLSGGQKQMVCLASVMAMQPDILILDEPTAQLDPISAHDFLEAVARINRELGTTVILSEHRLEEALPLSNAVWVMEKGEILAQGNASQIGRLLKENGSEMFCALPTPMRAYYSLEKDGDCPVTVSQGRKWLSQSPVKNTKLKDEAYPKGEAVIEAKEVYFRYEKNSPDVLKGLSFKLHKGEFYAIVGGNGSGKTTALKAIMGIVAPYSGKIKVTKGKKIRMLPQNPQSILGSKTVLCDLQEVSEDSEQIQRIAELCRIEGIISSHPYDLSGGEMQRVALAKVLLCRPDILLLDEPTKGLDAHFKAELNEILKELLKSGVAILMVSHDVEFCAEYTHKTGMLFDGQLLAENTPREFFGGNSFYTTSASRMSRGILDKAVLCRDIVNAVGGEAPRIKAEKEEEVHISKTEVKKEDKKPREKKPNRAGKTIAPVISMLLVPLTVIFGMIYLKDRRYYFISLLIILELMLPFVFTFERGNGNGRRLVLVSILCAFGIIGRIGLAFLPQVKPVLAIVIISGAYLGGETGFMVGAISAFVSNFYFGQGPWTPWQMFAFGLIGYIAGVLFYKGLLKSSKTALCIFGFLSSVVIFGGIMNPASVLMFQPNPTREMILSSMAMGFPLDAVQGLVTMVFLWFGAKPVGERLIRVRNKWNM